MTGAGRAQAFQTIIGARLGGWLARAWVAAAAILLGSRLPPVAHAEGKTIAEAAPVTYAQQQFGNTGNGGTGESHCGGSGQAYRSW